MNNFLRCLVAGLGLSILLSEAAFATPCSQIQQSIASGQCTAIPSVSGPSCIANYQEMHPECFGSTSSTAGATQEIRATTIQQMLTISNAIGARMAAFQVRPEKVTDSGLRSGMSAGNAPAQWNVWGSVSGDSNKYDRGIFLDTFGTQHQNLTSTNVTNGVLGGDYQLSPTLAVGVSAAFDNASGSALSYTSGALQNLVSLSTKGYSVAPYIGWQINKDWSLDASLGLGKGDVSSSDATSNLTGKADRLFFGADVSYADWYGNWQMTGKGSYLHGEEKFGDMTSVTGVMPNTATTNKIDQFRLGAQAGYWMNDSAMPYFGLTYSNDFSLSTSASAAVQQGTDIGKSAFVWVLGVNLFSIKNSMTGGIAYNQETGRTYAKNSSLMANINYRF